MPSSTESQSPTSRIVSEQAVSLATAPVIEVEALTTGYGRQSVLDGVTFSVASGELVGLIGPNGSGKSTLLKALIGLRPIWGGRIDVLGGAPAAARPRIGYMPQAESVDWSFPVTVKEVVAMGLYRPRLDPRRLRRSGARQREAVADAMEQMRIAHLGSRQIGELSGGQQRRVLLARTLVKDPDLLLLDEPAAGLDASIEHDLMALLRDLARAGKTLVVATHDLTSVYEFYSTALCLNRRVMAYGPPREALSEDVLIETFGRHLMVFYRDDHGYTAEPHVHHGVHDHD